MPNGQRSNSCIFSLPGMRRVVGGDRVDRARRDAVDHGVAVRAAERSGGFIL